MKHRYYYNGNLVRTSEREYTHAVINNQTGRLVACSGSERLAQNVKSSAESECRRGIRNAEAAYKALVAGKSYYREEYGRRTYPVKFHPDDTPEGMQTWKAEVQARLEHIQRDWAIVELEKR